MLLVVGLGNPGVDYTKNRHNIGFLALEKIHHAYDFSPFRSKFKGDTAVAIIDSKKVMLLKPNTYMNLSGHAVKAAKTFYKIPSKNVLVFHDELDLEFNKVRVKRGGGHAGHNGLKSIHNYIGANYGRVRLGIGHPGDKTRVTSYVLQNFKKDEMISVVKLLDAIAKEFPRLVRGDDGGFMSKVANTMSLNTPQPELKPKSPHTIKES
ncbi:MAG: aminoacyl-tRNA hydrolase [Magnetovibrio sp.]|nr:aminoacyl-tRNA hydrolase [Magnetovibrio sp.]|tara:strand:+ start:311 stop:934 length:624 start_codon:yes stop_codon:yes gene_type:complete